MTESRSIGRRTTLLVPFVVLLLTACATGNGDRCPNGGESLVSESLYFGTAIPAGGVVSAEQWEAFVAREITSRFPNGLTSWRAKGQWRGADGVLWHEDSYVLFLLHPDTPERDKAVTEIIDRYRTEFRQESVLRVRSDACVSF